MASASMPSPVPVAQFGAIRTELSELLRDALERKETIHGKFLPRGVARRIFRDHKSKVRGLYLAARSERTEEHSHIDHGGADAFLDSVIGENDDSALSNVLATLVSTTVDPTGILWLRFESLCRRRWALRNGRSSIDSARPLAFSDVDLPLSRIEVRDFLGQDNAQCDIFFDNQFIYCPLMLRNNDMVSCVGDRKEWRTPFLEEQKIREGSYGKVYRVKVARGHMNASTLEDADGNVVCARKDFEIDEGDEPGEQWDVENKQRASREWKILTSIFQNASRHGNIMAALGGLQTTMTLSIFFELANCDLDDFMRDPQRGLVPQDFESRISRLKQFSGIAGALHHLHNQMKSTDMQRMTCFHLDLKPRNILVVNLGTPRETFMITDFSISRIKCAGVGRDYKRLFTLDRSLRDFSTESKLGDAATCIAPETFGLPKPQPVGPNYKSAAAGAVGAPQGPEKRASAKTDIWHLGCVLSMFIAWVHDGPTGLSAFDKRRINDQNGGDWFWTSSVSKRKPKVDKDARPDRFAFCRPMPGSNGAEYAVFTLNYHVEAWFEQLLKRIRGREEWSLYNSLWNLLRTGLLVPDPDGRLKIEDVLPEITTALEADETSQSRSHQTTNERPSRSSKTTQLAERVKDRFSKVGK